MTPTYDLHLFYLRIYLPPLLLPLRQFKERQNYYNNEKQMAIINRQDSSRLKATNSKAEAKKKIISKVKGKERGGGGRTL